jgi:hypothetical protein
MRDPLLPGYFADPAIVRDRGEQLVFATIDPSVPTRRPVALTYLPGLTVEVHVLEKSQSRGYRLLVCYTR